MDEDNNFESFMNSITSQSKYSDVCDDYSQVIRLSKDLGPTTNADLPKNNLLESSEKKFEKAKDINNDDNKISINSMKIPKDSNEQEVNKFSLDKKIEDLNTIKEDKNNNSIKENKKDEINKSYENSINQSLNKSINVNNIDNTNLSTSINNNINNTNIYNSNNNNIKGSELKESKKYEEELYSYKDSQSNFSSKNNFDTNNGFNFDLKKKKTINVKDNISKVKNNLITFDNNLYPLDNSIDEEQEIKDNLNNDSLKQKIKVKRSFKKFNTFTGNQLNNNLSSKLNLLDFNKDRKSITKEFKLKSDISKTIKKRNKYDLTKILKKAVLLNGRKGNKKSNQQNLDDDIFNTQIVENNADQSYPINNIKFNKIRIDEINTNFLKKHLRRINVESKIKYQNEKFFHTLIELQNFYIDNTPVWVIKLNKIGKYLACGCKSGKIKIYEVIGYNYSKFRTNYDKKNIMDYLNFIPENPYNTLERHKSDVIDLSWSTYFPNLLLSASLDHYVILWDIDQEGYNCIIKEYEHNDIVTCVRFNPYIKNRFISGCLDTFVYVWKFDYGENFIDNLEDKYKSKNDNTLNDNSGGHILAASNKKKKIKKKKSKQDELSKPNNSFEDVNKTNTNLNTQQNQDRIDYFNLEHKITALSYFPDGSKIAVGTENGRIYVYNTFPKIAYNYNFVVSQKKFWIFNGGKKVTNIQFINKNLAIISTSDSYVRLVNMQEGIIIYQYKGYVNKSSMTRAFTDVSDDVIIVGGEDGNCCLWNLYSKEKRLKIKDYEFFKPFSKEIIESSIIVNEESYVNYMQKLLKLTNKILITSIIINGTSKGRLEILLNIDESIIK